MVIHYKLGHEGVLEPVHLGSRGSEVFNGSEDIAAEPADLLARSFQVSCRKAINGTIPHLLHQIPFLHIGSSAIS